MSGGGLASEDLRHGLLRVERGPARVPGTGERHPGGEHPGREAARGRGRGRAGRCHRAAPPVGAFPPEVFRLSASTTYNLAENEFGCHACKRDEPKTCTGFLLLGAAHNVTVRMYGPDIAEVSSTHPLYDNYREMAVANGVDPDDPVLVPCRDSRPYVDTDGVPSPDRAATPGSMG